MISKRLFSVLFVAASVVALLAGCGEPGPGAPTQPPVGKITPPPPITSGPAGTPKVATPTQDTSIVFEQTGGVAGLQQKMEIDSTGKVTLSDRGNPTGTFQLSKDQFDSLNMQFKTSGFFSLKDSYDKGGIADDIYNMVTFTRAGRTKSIKVASEGGKGLTPPALQQLIDTLKQIESQGQPAQGGQATPSGVTPGASTPAPQQATPAPEQPTPTKSGS